MRRYIVAGLWLLLGPAATLAGEATAAFPRTQPATQPASTQNVPQQSMSLSKEQKCFTLLGEVVSWSVSQSAVDVEKARETLESLKGKIRSASDLREATVMVAGIDPKATHVIIVPSKRDVGFGAIQAILGKPVTESQGKLLQEPFGSGLSVQWEKYGWLEFALSGGKVVAARGDCAALRAAGTSTPATTQPGTATQVRSRLVSELLKRGDAVEQLPERRWAYRFAADYAPSDPVVKAKVESLPKSFTFSLSEAEIAAARAIVYHLRSEYCRNWPGSTTDQELIELRMLLDTRLVGDLRFNTFTFQNGPTARFFLNNPSLTPAQIQEAYGPPTGKLTMPDGDDVLMHGRFRFVVVKGKVVAMLIR